jgi:hypothetical protein
MACARCDFDRPKGSTKTQLVEPKGEPPGMLASIPLTTKERAAINDGTAAVERLTDVPRWPAAGRVSRAIRKLHPIDKREWHSYQWIPVIRGG